VVLNLLSDFKFKVTEPVKIYEDYSGSVAIAKYENMTKNAKYIEVHYHYVNEFFEKNS